MSFYLVQRGDSPASIARRHGVSIGSLLGANPHKPVVAVGQVRTWQSLGLGERLNLPVGVGAITPAPLNAVHKQISINNPGPHVADADVALWQTIVGATPDGLFGPNTQAATKAWQAAHGLAADGIVGPKTWAAATLVAAPAAAAASLPQIATQILSQLPSIPGITPAAAPAPVPTAAPTVTPAAPAAAAILASGIDPCLSDNAQMVCAAQRVLGVAADGKYGNETATALRKFIPGAPPGCSPRPAWWTPTGQSNCNTVAAAPSLPSLPSLPLPVPSAAPSLPSIPSVLPMPSTSSTPLPPIVLPTNPPTVVPLPSVPSIPSVLPTTAQPGPVQPTVTAPAKAGISPGVMVAGGLGAVALVAMVAMSGKHGGGRAPASRRSGGHKARRTSRKRR